MGQTLLAVVAVAAIALSTTLADATTGPTALPQPKQVVPRAIGDRFVGRYVIDSVPRTARVTAGELKIDWTTTDKPFLLGFLVLYGYDAAGRQSSMIVNAYPFSAAGQHEVRAMLSAQGSGTMLGRATFRTEAGGHTLDGTISLGGRHYALSYRPLPAKATDITTLPPARLTDPLPHRGPGSVQGTYTLRSTAPTPGASAGIYAPVVALADKLAGDDDQTSRGVLRIRPSERSHTIAGTLRLETAGTRRQIYLTDFRWGGTRHTATARRGSADGAVIGRLDVTATDQRLDGTLTLDGRTLDVRLDRRP